MAIRLDPQLRSLLVQGARQTRYNPRQLIHLTLRRHLGQVIAEERIAQPHRITAAAPWPKGALAKAYKRIEKNWDRIEAAAAAAQSKPAWED